MQYLPKTLHMPGFARSSGRVPRFHLPARQLSSLPRHSPKAVPQTPEPAPDVRGGNIGTNLAVGALGLLGAGLYVYCNRVGEEERLLVKSFNGRDLSLQTGTTRSFTLTQCNTPFDVYDPAAVIETVHLVRSVEDNERFLKQQETIRLPNRNRKGNPVVAWHKNTLAVTDPHEDRNSGDHVDGDTLARLLGAHHEQGGLWGAWDELRSRNLAKSKFRGAAAEQEGGLAGADDLVFLTVIDGHAGSAVSELLYKTLHACLATAVGKLKAGHLHPGLQERAEKLNGLLDPKLQETVADETACLTAQTLIDVYVS
jgi:hypothetical protein